MGKLPIKEFLRPEWKKIVVFLPILLLNLFSGIKSYSFYSATETIYGDPLPFLTIYIERLPPTTVVNWNFRNLSIHIIVWISLYLFSCLIIWIYDKVKKK